MNPVTTGSSEFAGYLNDIVQGIYAFMEPLVNAAAGLQKLLELLPH